MTGNPATVSVVTGPDGHDIGPAAAHLGRHLADGLAIRTVVSGADPGTHRSPVPGGRLGSGREYTAVDLEVLPSAWQDPQTNLGVAYTDRVDARLVADLKTMQILGLDPSHRLTVQHHGLPRVGLERSDREVPRDIYVPPPVEVGNLGEQARDSVLRSSAGSSRHVLIEAGDGQTLLDAMHTVGLEPWNTHIDQLDLWLVIDADRLLDGMPIAEHSADDRPRLAAARLAVEAQVLVRANGGGLDGQGRHRGNLWLAVANIQTVIPALDGVTAAQLPDIPGDVGDALTDLMIAVENTSGCAVGLLGTGGASGPWIDTRDLENVH